MNASFLSRLVGISQDALGAQLIGTDSSDVGKTFATLGSNLFSFNRTEQQRSAAVMEQQQAQGTSSNSLDALAQQMGNVATAVNQLISILTSSAPTVISPVAQSSGTTGSGMITVQMPQLEQAASGSVNVNVSQTSQAAVGGGAGGAASLALAPAGGGGGGAVSPVLSTPVYQLPQAGGGGALTAGITAAIPTTTGTIQTASAAAAASPAAVMSTMPIIATSFGGGGTAAAQETLASTAWINVGDLAPTLRESLTQALHERLGGKELATATVGQEQYVGVPYALLDQTMMGMALPAAEAGAINLDLNAYQGLFTAPAALGEQGPFYVASKWPTATMTVPVAAAGISAPAFPEQVQRTAITPAEDWIYQKFVSETEQLYGYNPAYDRTSVFTRSVLSEETLGATITAATEPFNLSPDVQQLLFPTLQEVSKVDVNQMMQALMQGDTNWMAKNLPAVTQAASQYPEQFQGLLQLWGRTAAALEPPSGAPEAVQVQYQQAQEAMTPLLMNVMFGFPDYMKAKADIEKWVPGGAEILAGGITEQEIAQIGAYGTRFTTEAQTVATWERSYNALTNLTGQLEQFRYEYTNRERLSTELLTKVAPSVDWTRGGATSISDTYSLANYWLQSQAQYWPVTAQTQAAAQTIGLFGARVITAELGLTPKISPEEMTKLQGDINSALATLQASGVMVPSLPFQQLFETWTARESLAQQMAAAQRGGWSDVGANIGGSPVLTTAYEQADKAYQEALNKAVSYSFNIANLGTSGGGTQLTYEQELGQQLTPYTRGIELTEKMIQLRKIRGEDYSDLTKSLTSQIDEFQSFVTQEAKKLYEQYGEQVPADKLATIRQWQQTATELEIVKQQMGLTGSTYPEGAWGVTDEQLRGIPLALAKAGTPVAGSFMLAGTESKKLPGTQYPWIEALPLSVKPGPATVYDSGGGGVDWTSVLNQWLQDQQGQSQQRRQTVDTSSTGWLAITALRPDTRTIGWQDAGAARGGGGWGAITGTLSGWRDAGASARGANITVNNLIVVDVTGQNASQAASTILNSAANVSVVDINTMNAVAVLTP